MKSSRALLGCAKTSNWLLGFVAALACVAACPARGDELPRYRLKVGQELTYKTVEPPPKSEDSKPPTLRILNQWAATVLGQNADGSWQLLLRQEMTVHNFFNGKDNVRTTITDGFYDLWPDGRLVDRREEIGMMDVSSLFPPLPPDAQSQHSGWESRNEKSDTRREMHVAEQVAGSPEWRFAEESHGPWDAIYLLSIHRDYDFDLQQGLLRRVTTTTRQGWPARGAGEPDVSTAELTGTRQLDEEEWKTLAAESTIYFEADRRFHKLSQQALEDYEHAGDWLDKAEACLREVDGKLTLPSMHKMVADALQQDKQTRNFTSMAVAAKAALLGKPAPEFKTTDLDGTPHALADYAGKVVVLDFWYRGCGWCIRAMPQIKQVVDDFSGQEVAVLGMNWDAVEDDARFVVDALKLNYTTLKNGQGINGIHIKYRVLGWPTLIVIDTKGNVRSMHFGYSPTLRRDLGQHIRELLAENKSAAAP